ncbi:MAG: GNAT family N-acetyltransferase [Tissierellia bacterium]|nr:GNAT family N-acetyltransferase [Tissierellia bacterium]
MSIITKHEYLENPCGNSSLPYYKLKSYNNPNIRVIHNSEFIGEKSEPYFRLMHNLKDGTQIDLDENLTVRTIDTTSDEDLHRLEKMIENCYENERLPVAQMKIMINSNQFDESLWIVVENKQREIVASAISEFDNETKEGVLEWIQVLPKFHGRGLGAYIVCETLKNLRYKADFATVSGRVNNTHSPEDLYRKCGFTGSDIWHVILK